MKGFVRRSFYPFTLTLSLFPHLMYDAVIAGAGPGGSTAATCMARAGLRVLLVDKSTFPRDKICGDALSGKSVDVLRRLGLIGALREQPQIASHGIVFSGPRGDAVTVPFSKTPDPANPPGYVCDRLTFDALLFDAAVQSGAEVWTGAQVTGLLRDGDRVTGITVARGGQTTDVQARLTVGADGAYSAVARSLGHAQLDERYYSAGLRVYYEGVTGFDAMNSIELHFVDEALPGYFWIFPMADGRANVGLGILSSEVKKRGLKLKDVLQRCIDHPRFRDRFAHARALGAPKGWGLPLGSRIRPLAGDGYLLVGDAASLIDPFTGEGIGNAMVSAEIAARYAAEAAQKGTADATLLQGYADDVQAYLRDELRLSHALQRLSRWRWLLNTVIRKASRVPEVADALSSMFDDEAQRRKLVTPGFYLRLLTA